MTGALGYTPLSPSNNLSDVANAATARSNIGAGTGNGTVTSVDLTMPGVIFNTSTGGPVTTSGTLSPTLKTQTANTVFAGPTSGAAAAPSFRALVAADMPSSVVKTTDTGTVTNTMLAGSIDLTAKVTGTLPAANGGTGSAFFGVAGPTAPRTYTFPDAPATIARTDTGQTFTGSNVFSASGASGLKVLDGSTVILEANRGGAGRVEGQFYDRASSNQFALVGQHMAVSNAFNIAWRSGADWFTGSYVLSLRRAKDGVLGIGDDQSETNGATFRAKARTAAQLTADQNNYDPGGVSLNQRWSSDASRTVTGLSISQVDGEYHFIWNVGSNNIVLANESASSTDANRFTTSAGADLTLAPSKCVLVIYDGTTSRWRAVLLP